MSTLIVIAAVLAGLAAYLAAGWHIARKRLPRAWAKARENWHFDNSIRSSVRWQTIGTCLVWPAVLLWCAIAARMDQVIDAGDPVELERKIRDRDRRIAQLEREAGIRP